MPGCLRANFQQQPSPQLLAEQARRSPFHSQRQFQKWAGVSPKKFLPYLSLDHTEGLLRQQASVLEAAYETSCACTSKARRFS